MLGQSTGITDYFVYKMDKRLQGVHNAAVKTALHLPYRTRIKFVHKTARIDPIRNRLNAFQSAAVSRFSGIHLMASLEIQRLLHGK